MERWTVPDLTDFNNTLFAHEGHLRRIRALARLPHLSRRGRTLLGTATPTSRSFRRDALSDLARGAQDTTSANSPMPYFRARSFRESRGVLIVIAVVGFVSGAVLALSLLTYSARRP